MKTMVLRTARVAFPVLAGISMCTACSTTGTAIGRLEQPAGKADAVTFVWKSDAAEPERGSISGTLPDGSHYSGRYFEVLKTAPADVYEPAWVGWRPYWGGWHAGWYSRPIGDLDWPTFVTIYTGKVIANLRSDDGGTRLRCRFQVDDPRAGLARGGAGDCQLSNGETIDHVVVAPS